MEGIGPMAMSAQERALTKIKLDGGGHSVPDTAENYHKGGGEDERLRREIMERLDAASLSPEDLLKKALHQRIDEYFEALQKKNPR